MTTDKQIASNRANAARSTGPTSPEGRQISSRNSIRHGLLAATVVLENESLERFHDLMTDLDEQFRPVNAAECALVETMAVAHWRQLRLRGIEKSSLTYQISKQTDDEMDYDASTRTALAFRTLADSSRSLDLMNRYEARYDRQYERALNKLIEMRGKK